MNALQPKSHLNVLIFVEITTLVIVCLARDSPVLLVIAGAGLLMSSVTLFGLIWKKHQIKK